MAVDCLELMPRHLQQRLASGLAMRNQGYRGRFAPSPTGALHRGNLRTALLSWLDARLADGVWLLRIDDLDSPRVVAGAEAQIRQDLRWLGLDWDGPVLRQSERRGLYSSVLAALRRAGVLYPCRCSRRLLADVSAPHGGWTVYPRFCREREPAWGALQGRLPSWRLRLDPGPLHWVERWGPPVTLDAEAAVGDVVLRRADGFIAYHLATAIDELELGITTVVRGIDLWQSTAPQVAVMALLAAQPPGYGHVPLWCDAGGVRLSKRDGAQGLAGFQARGLSPAAVVGELASSLQLVPPASTLSPRELVEHLRQHPGHLERAMARATPAPPKI